MARFYPSMKNEIIIKDADWPAWGDRLSELRNEIFVIEQNVPPDLEIDGLDSECQHVVAIHKELVIGTGRLLPSSFIGRMCVKCDYRGQGVGGRMLGQLISVARRLGYPQVSLNAQSQVIPFYRNHGFQIASEPFIEAGILHQEMLLNI